MANMTLGQLGQKIDDLKEFTGIEIRDVKKRLDKINGATQKNTAFRNMMVGALKILGMLVGGGGLISVIWIMILNG